MSTPKNFWTVVQISSVRSLVLPPAPQVQSQNSGSVRAMRSMRSKRLRTPESVLGGKYSKEKKFTSSPRAFILSIIFMMTPVQPDADWPQHFACQYRYTGPGPAPTVAKTGYLAGCRGGAERWPLP